MGKRLEAGLGAASFVYCREDALEIGPDIAAFEDRTAAKGKLGAGVIILPRGGCIRRLFGAETRTRRPPA